MASGNSGSTDEVEQALLDLRHELGYAQLPDTVRAAITTRVIDTTGALFAGFVAPPCAQLRGFAATAYPAPAAALIGSAQRTTVEMAAFVNATTARFAELNDTYHVPGKPGVHASDVIMPLVAVAEYCDASGPQLIEGVGLAYEVCLRLFDATRTSGFDSTNFVALGVAMGAAALLDLDDAATRNCLAIVAVATIALRRARVGELSTWKAAASGQAGRSAAFAALLAEHGVDGPTHAFTGVDGWCQVVAPEGIDLSAVRAPEGGFRLMTSIIKPRGACGTTIPAIMAAEAAHRALGPQDVIERVLVETFRDAKVKNATGRHHWAPTTREAADHSIPYVVAAALREGTVGPRQFDEAHLGDPELRGTVSLIEVVEHDAFTAAYGQVPCQHRCRLTVWTTAGTSVIGEAGGEFGDLSDPVTDAAVDKKFLTLASPELGDRAAAIALEHLRELAAQPRVRALTPYLTGTSG